MHSRRSGCSLNRLLLLLGATTALSTAAHAFDVTTYNYDAQRTGLNNTEATLTQAAVGSSAFHQLHSVALPFQVDAQPLVISAATMASWGYASQFPHDVVYIADEANNVLAVDSSTGAILLQKNFGTPVSLQNLPGQCGNNASTVGITSTPVIDPANKVMYFVTYTWENGAAVYRIHEINLADLSEKTPSVVVTAASQLSDGSAVSFSAGSQRQRPALLMANGNVYAGFASFCDQNNNISRGWMLGWQTGTLKPLASAELTVQQTAAQSTAPAAFGETGPLFLSSIWMSGYGAAADSSGYVYFQTGNSDANRANNLPDSVVRMTPDLSSVNDYFTPSNFAALDQVDEDRGSGGVMIVPDQPNGLKFAVSDGKDGRLFLHNRSTGLGGFVANGADIPTFVNADLCWCGPAYYVGSDGQARVVSTGGTQAQTWLVPTTASGALTAEAGSPQLPNLDGQDPGFMATVSSNGTVANSAVIWSLSRPSNRQIFLQALSGTLGGGATTIYDKAGRAWSFGAKNASLPANQQLVLNGSPVSGAYGVDMVTDSTGTLWHMNSQNFWYSYNGSGWTGQGSGPNLAVPSPAGLAITPATGGTVTDGSGNVWSFGPAAGTNSLVLVNGSPAFGAYAVKIVIDTTGTMWHTNAAGGWWSYNGNGGWTGQPSSGPNFSIPSSAGTFIIPSTGGLVTDKAGRVWSFGMPSTTSPANYQILLNGSPAFGAYGVEIIIDSSGTMWHTNSFGPWWYYNGNGGWVGASGPSLPPPWKPGATVSAAGRLPRLQIVPAGQWPNVGGNANLVPVVANGKVYVASYGQLTIWGLTN